MLPILLRASQPYALSPGKSRFCTSAMKRFEGIIHLSVQVGIFSDELGRESIEQTQQIVRHQNLPITTSPCSDSDGGDG